LEPEYIRQWKAEYSARRKAARLTRNFTLNDAGTAPGRDQTFEQREREFERRWNETGGIGFMYAYPDMTTNDTVNRHASEFVRRKIREIVKDQEVANLLCPRDYGIGGKRICVDTGYFEIFNRANVELVDLKKEPIARVTAKGVRTQSGEIPLDALVLALGFDAMTGALLRVDIRGREGISLRERWKDGPRTYLGIAVSGFPNMFIVTAPGSPSVFASMVTAIEQHVDWIADCISRMRERGYTCIDATMKAEADWVAHVNEVGAPTMLPQDEEICKRVAAGEYEGFVRA
jgi:cyclohexanone monooxygenase